MTKKNTIRLEGAKLSSMSYIDNLLEPGETIRTRAHVHRISYIGALILLAALMTPGRLSGLASTELALTEKRVIGKTGLIRRKKISLYYKDIEIARVSQGILGRLFDYGSLTISGKDGSRITFKGIAWPLDLQQQIEEAVEVAVLGHKLADSLDPKGP